MTGVIDYTNYAFYVLNGDIIGACNIIEDGNIRINTLTSQGIIFG
jgi:hypothetical protein